MNAFLITTTCSPFLFSIFRSNQKYFHLDFMLYFTIPQVSLWLRNFLLSLIPISVFPLVLPPVRSPHRQQRKFIQLSLAECRRSCIVSHQIKVACTFIQISFAHSSNTETTTEVSESDQVKNKSSYKAKLYHQLNKSYTARESTGWLIIQVSPRKL